MGKRRRTSPNAAEGQHGRKTHRQFIDGLHSTAPREPVEDRLSREHERSAAHGRSRLEQDRQQHDEAEKNSERTETNKKYDLGTID
jgi:hypothetical protein